MSLKLLTFYSCFYWKKEHEKELDRHWTLFFLIYESLDNFAAHLIQPIWDQFFTLLPKCNDAADAVYLNFCWPRVLLGKIFTHESFIVQRLGMISLLDMDYAIYKPISDMQFVCRMF